MLMTGQPQAVAGAGRDVRLQQSAGTTVFRVCGSGTCLVFSPITTFVGLLCSCDVKIVLQIGTGTGKNLGLL